MADLDKLEALAREAKAREATRRGGDAAWLNLHSALSPSVVLELVREARRVKRMRNALLTARARIAEDRRILFDSHANANGVVEDFHGLHGIAEYDEALAAIAIAIGEQGQEGQQG